MIENGADQLTMVLPLILDLHTGTGEVPHLSESVGRYGRDDEGVVRTLVVVDFIWFASVR